jgi:prophage DNA circulation protein
LLYLADNGFDDMFRSLNDIRVAMVKDINTRAATLKNVKYVKINDSLPALVFAYVQYADATLDIDVIKRNRIRNPVLIPPQSSLEVLV